MFLLGITLVDVAIQAGVQLDILSGECSTNILLRLAQLCDNWQLIGKNLGHSEADIIAIDGDKRTVEEKRVEMLRKWKERHAYKADYKTFINTLLTMGKAAQAIKAAKIIGAG